MQSHTRWRRRMQAFQPRLAHALYSMENICGAWARAMTSGGDVEPFNQRLYVNARHESELKVHLGALGDKLRVAHRLGKRLRNAVPKRG